MTWDERDDWLFLARVAVGFAAGVVLLLGFAWGIAAIATHYSTPECVCEVAE